MNILDGYEFKGHKISVERAKFELKGNYDPTKKKRKLSKHEKKKFQEKQERFEITDVENDVASVSSLLHDF